MMKDITEALYNKAIVLKKNNEVIRIVIYDLETHTPVFYKVVKDGMDDIIELFDGNKNKNEGLIALEK